ncbi:hypothetical protein BD626DRAFT_506998 [Schizophyllum amplum]|uniref:Uncharacterized protein n=1 Tax=Schizophyllum amplum TaxID=97359 RepID=A0A550C4D6_9AGAR|nr:hypothetical protein BD626DRAFT_506998 [Auriculariopsis ampla]
MSRMETHACQCARGSGGGCGLGAEQCGSLGRGGKVAEQSEGNVVEQMMKLVDLYCHRHPIQFDVHIQIDVPTSPIAAILALSHPGGTLISSNTSYLQIPPQVAPTSTTSRSGRTAPRLPRSNAPTRAQCCEKSCTEMAISLESRLYDLHRVHASLRPGEPGRRLVQPTAYIDRCPPLLSVLECLSPPAERSSMHCLCAATTPTRPKPGR